MESRSIPLELNGFVLVPETLLKQYGMVRANIFGRIWRYTKMTHGVCTASMNTIAEDLGMTRPGIIPHVKALVNDGYLIDTTPDLKNRPHVYADAGKIVFRSGMWAEPGVNEVDSTVNKVDSTVNEVYTSTVNEVYTKNSTEKNTIEEKVKNKTPSYSPTGEDVAVCGTDGLTPDRLAEIFIEINEANGKPLPNPIKITPNRRKKMVPLTREYPDEEFWRRAFTVACTDPFYSGRDGKWTNCSFDWFFCNDKKGNQNCIKLAERFGHKSPEKMNSRLRAVPLYLENVRRQREQASIEANERRQLVGQTD